MAITTRASIAARRKQALTEAAELAKLERKLIRETKPVLKYIENMALKYQSKFNLHTPDIRKLQDLLTQGKVLATLYSRRRASRNVKVESAKQMKMSVIDQITSKFKGATEQEVQDLVAYFEPSTLDVISNLTTRLNTGVRQALEEAINSEVSPKAAIKSFFSNLGMDSNNPRFFETLLRTQTQLAYSAAKWDEYQDPAIDEIIWGYQYVTVGDDRVRPEHAELDGVTLPKEDPFWQTFFPPNGYNCRCTAIPIFDKEPIKRAPEGARTDPGFNFNPADLVRRL